MNKKELKDLIKKKESQSLEFKRNLENIGKSICSFANSNNGIILVGIDDKGSIIGTKKKFEREIANIAHTCKPSIYPEIKEVKVDDKIALTVKVKKSGSLHSYKNIAR
ncbi:ATP-binding protein [Patescibacteria group bacterium AH-259-L07]|nr:ATP-binding protein [Patescibacteria group bacterium AH-259-L07]